MDAELVFLTRLLCATFICYMNLPGSNFYLYFLPFLIFGDTLKVGMSSDANRYIGFMEFICWMFVSSIDMLASLCLWSQSCYAVAVAVSR